MFALVRRNLFAIALVLFVLAACRPARAQDALIFTLENPNPTVRPGDIFQFVATVQNSDPANTIQLIGASFDSLNGPGSQGNEYFTEFPGALGPNNGTSDPTSPNSYTGRLFDVAVDQTALDGDTVSGTYAIDYQVGTGPVQTAMQNFVITVRAAAVPEPGLVLSTGLALSGGLILRRRQRRATVS